MKGNIKISQFDKIVNLLIDKLKIKSSKKNGRPVKYKDETILLALAVKIILNLSFRETEEFLKIYLPSEQVPDHTTLYYRFKKLPIEKIEKIIKQTAEQIIKKLGNKEIYAAIADGTGFGYNEAYYLNNKRGAEIKKIKSHIKTEVLIGSVNGKKFVLSVKTDKAYTDENKLLLEMLNEGVFEEIRGRYFLGDKYYGKNVKVLEEINRLGFDVIVPVKDTLRQKVRNKYRLKAKHNYEKGFKRKIYRRHRYKVEQLIGNVKNWFGDRFNTKSFELAQRYVLVSFLLYNLYLLVRLYFLLFYFIIFLSPFFLLLRLFKHPCFRF